MSFCPDEKIPFIYARIMADIFSTNNVLKEGRNICGKKSILIS